MQKQYFIVNADRDRIYPLKKELVHITVTLLDGIQHINVCLSGIPLVTSDSIKQALRIKRMIQNFEGRNGAVCLVPGFSNYQARPDWIGLLDMYHRFEEMEAALSETD